MGHAKAIHCPTFTVPRSPTPPLPRNARLQGQVAELRASLAMEAQRAREAAARATALEEVGPQLQQQQVRGGGRRVLACVRRGGTRLDLAGWVLMNPCRTACTCNPRLPHKPYRPAYAKAVPCPQVMHVLFSFQRTGEDSVNLASGHTVYLLVSSSLASCSICAPHQLRYRLPAGGRVPPSGMQSWGTENADTVSACQLGVYMVLIPPLAACRRMRPPSRMQRYLLSPCAWPHDGIHLCITPYWLPAGGRGCRAACKAISYLPVRSPTAAFTINSVLPLLAACRRTRLPSCMRSWWSCAVPTSS